MEQTMRTVLIAGALALAATVPSADLLAAGARDYVADLERSRDFVEAGARGQATFQLNGASSELRFEVAVESIGSVNQAHIHLDPDALARDRFPSRYRDPSESRHGPIVAFLMRFVRGGVTVDGVLAEGAIRESDLVGPLRGQPLSALVEFMDNGEVYVAVHVLEPIPPDQTFCCPVGLRGTVRAVASQ